MDYSQLPLSKGRPASLLREDRRKARESKDRAENKFVKERSGGRCEVVEIVRVGNDAEARLGFSTGLFRCNRRATQVHHMIGGNGKRGRGISALAKHKQHVCDECHLLITGYIGGKKLWREGGMVPLWTDRYRVVSDGKTWRRIT